jgi:hypothetical protein
MARRNGKPNDQNQPSIVAVRKSDAGIITDFKLSNGQVMTKQEAVNYAKTNGIQGVNVGMTRGEDHTPILRANPTDDPEKALANKPTF